MIYIIQTVIRIHKHNAVQAIPAMNYPENALKPQIWPVSRSRNCGKSTDRDHNLISSEGNQNTSLCQISGHFLNRVSGKCLETFLDRQMSGRTNGIGLVQILSFMHVWATTHVLWGATPLSICQSVHSICVRCNLRGATPGRPSVCPFTNMTLWVATLVVHLLVHLKFGFVGCNP